MGGFVVVTVYLFICLFMFIFVYDPWSIREASKSPDGQDVGYFVCLVGCCFVCISVRYFFLLYFGTEVTFTRRHKKTI